MAQTGYSKVQIYSSSTATHTPSAGNLTNDTNGSELAINITDGKLFYKDNSGTVQVLATKGSGVVGGSNTQVQYNSSGTFAGSANLTFDGTTLTSSGFSGPFNGTVGATTANTGAFTTLSASSTVSGTGFSTYLASPPAIGGTAAAAGSFTNLAYTGTLTGGTGVVNLGSGQFYKDASGNVGVGTTSPNISGGASGSQVITISATTSGRNGLLELKGTRTNSGDVVSYVRAFNNSGSTPITDIQSIRGASDTTGSLAFFTSNTEAARIDSSGNLYLGTTSQIGSGFVSLKFNSGPNNGITMQDTATSYGGSYVYFINSSAAQAGLIAHATATTVLYTATSDRRLKTNIADITTEQSGPIIDALKPRSFNWSEDNIADVGFIADEFQAVIPRAVIGQPNATKEEEYEITPAVKDEQGNITTPAVIGTRTVPVYQSIEASTSEMIAYLVAEVQSLRARLKAANIA